MKTSIYHLFLAIILCACNSQIEVKFANLSGANSSIISGLISPFSGLIADNSFSSKFFLSQANAVMCADPVYAKLFLIQADGSVDDTSPISSQLVSSSATYSFDLAKLGLSYSDANVKYIVKAEGCNGNTYKRPVTSFDKNQNIDAKTTVVSEVINANTLVTTKLNQATRKDVEQLINAVSGATTSAAFTSITSDAPAITKFIAIFGTASSVIQNAKPEVILTAPSGAYNELGVNAFSINAFHVDPGYSLVYKWKLDGNLKSSASSWNYIPTANESGNHTISIYVGKNDGGGNVDITKPYYVKSMAVYVNNNILPTAPNVSVNAGTPSPRTTNSISIDIATGVTFANCVSFSHLAVTDTATVPGVMQFNVDCTSAGTQAQAVSFSTGDGNRTLYLWAIDVDGNISSAKTVSFILDMNIPTVAVTTPAGPLKGGSALTLNYSATDVNAISSLQLFYAADGVTYGGATSLTVGSTSYGWTVPASNVTTAKIKIVATDIAGNVGTAISNAFTVDSTAPTIPVISRTSSAFSNSTTVTINATCIADYDKILYSQTSTTPAVGDVNWEACAASKTFTVTTGDALKSIYAFTKDVVGNISASSNVTMTLDTTLPVIAVSTPSSLQGNVSTGVANWTLTETNVSASTTFTVEVYNGSTWVNVGTPLATAGVNSTQAYSLLNFAVPNVNITTAKTRVTLVDAAGNSNTTESGVYAIDSAAPVLSSVIINDGATFAGTALLNLKINVTDNLSSTIFIKLAAANSGTSDCQSEYVDTGWVTWVNATTNNAFFISPVDGVKKVCVWAKDSSGNVSVMSPTTGTVGVNYSTITYQAGNPPQITAINVFNTSSSTNVYALNDPVTISWSVTDAEGLDNNPISIAYSTDGTTWKDVVTNLTTTNTANITWLGGLSGNPTSTSASYTTFLAPTSGFFIIKILARDSAGNSSIPAQSQPQNTGSWSVFAGSTDRGDGGSGGGAALYSAGVTGLNLAINTKTNDIYTLDEAVGIRKLNIQTGKVSTFIAHGATNLSTSGAITSASRLSTDTCDRMIIDANGIMYLQDSFSAFASKIYKINLNTNTTSFYIGGGTDNSTGATPSTLFVSSGVLDVDSSGNLYFATDCNGTAPYYDTTKKLMMISQNGDGTPGVISHLAGNCTTGAFTSGQPAINQPLLAPAGLNQYINLSSVAAVNPNLIYFTGYGTNPMKIISGTIYSTNLGTNSRSGIVTYNRITNKMFRSVPGFSVSSFTPVSTGANGEVLTPYVASSGTGGCVADGVDATLACVVVDSGFAFDSSGIAYFLDGVVSNSPNSYRVRYVDPSNKVRTVFGSLPFYGEGLNKSLIRGKMSGIYYKKATEPNQTAFPAGLYFVSPSMILGHIAESDNIFRTLYGNQQGNIYTAPTGTTISASVSLGQPYGGGNGMPLMMDSSGLPWSRASNAIYKIDANKQVVNLTATSGFWTAVADGANPNLGSVYVHGGYQNFTLKNNGVFLIGGYYDTANDPVPQIRYLDFTAATSNMIMGGTYVRSLLTTMSPDIAIPGNVKAAPLSYYCTGGASCTIQYISSQDQLYFKNTADKYLRYISNPTNTAASTLTTMPLQFASTSVINFILREDLTQVFYITGNGLYCMDISSGKAWCDNVTNLYPYTATMGGFSPGANQMTWKDANTLLISNYMGKVLQYNLLP